MSCYEINKFNGGVSDFEDRGIAGSFKFGSNLDIRKIVDSLSCNQSMLSEGDQSEGRSPSASTSPSASVSPSSSPSPTNSPSASTSPSSSVSLSPSGSTGISDSPSLSPSASASPSASTSPSHSNSPSPSPSGGLNPTFKDLIQFFVKCTDGFTYGFGNTGYVYRRDSDGIWDQVYKDSDGEIKGAYEWYSDTGNTYLYFATDTLLKRKLVGGRSDWNDVTVVGNLTSADWHTMTEAGGSLIICNKSMLALVGYDDSFTNEALDLVPGNIANTVIEREGYSIVGSARVSNPTEGINAMIDGEVPLAQVGEDGEIYYSDLTNTMPIKRFPGGGKVNPGGVVNLVTQPYIFSWEQNSLSWIDKKAIGNLSLFGVYSATSGKNGIWSYGRKNKNHPFALNLEYAIDCDEIGAITQVNGTILASVKNGTDFDVYAVDPDNKAIGIYEGLDFKVPIKTGDGVANPVDVAVWKMAEVYMKPLPEGTNVEFWYRLDKT